MKRLALVLLLFCAMRAEAATFVVNSSADTNDGACDVANCTLREAINAANASGGGTIHFAIGSGPVNIILASVLPDLTTPIVLDATTQPGYAGAPIVQLTGVSTANDCLDVRASDTTVRGLDIGNCNDAISVVSTSGAMANITLERNYLGTRLATASINRHAIYLDTAGAATLSNVHIGDATPAGRNVLATFGFVADSLYVGGHTSDVFIAGNYFSISDTGAGLVSASRFITDITIMAASDSSNVNIGGAAAGARNVFGSGGGTQINVKIDSQGSGLTIENNYFGTDPAGTTPMPATNFAIWFFGQGAATIRNNVITAGNTAISRGVTTTGPVVVQGNWINLKADGSGAFPLVPAAAINDFSSAPGYLIGGPLPADGNVIANYATGISVSSPGATVQHNLVGLDRTGTTILGGGTRGIQTSFARVDPGVFILDNVVAGYTTGIDIGSEAKVTVQRNRVGTDITGTLALPNGTGIAIAGAAGNTILQDNVVSGNSGNGIVINATTMPVTMTGNRIGVGAYGDALPNGGDGIRVTAGTGVKNIGVPATTQNTIAHNGGAGVNVAGGNSTTIFNNSIFDNGQLAIDLGAAGPTPNDLADSDTGANGLQNAPLLGAATLSAGLASITGSLNSTPSTVFTIEIYSNPVADPSTFGEAQTLLTRFNVTTDGAGNASFTANNLSAGAGEVLSATATNTATNETSELSNDVGVPGIVQFTASSASVNESAGSVMLTVTRTGSGLPVTLQYASADGTAGAADYNAVSGTLVWAANDATPKTITIPITSDTLDENDETFTVTLSNASGAILGTPIVAQVTITDDDAAPSINIGDASVAEGDSGTALLTFDVQLSTVSERTVTVDYHTADQTATAGSDYGQRNGTLTFAPGETTKSVTVIVNGDTMTEADETLRLLLTDASNATLADGEGIGTITNDDGDPLISIGDATVVEGDSGSTNATLTVTLSNPSASAVSLDWSTNGATATSGSDFTASGNTLMIAAGTTTATITVPILGDAIVEPGEELEVNLSNASGGSISDAQGLIHIADDDGEPSLTISDVAVNESAGTATLTVLLAPASEQTVSVQYDLADGSATAPGDYTDASGTLTFPANTTTATITVTIADDDVAEGAESLTASLSAPSNATIARGTATLTIVDDDGTPNAAIDDASVVEGNAGTAPATFTVTLSNRSAATVTMNWAASAATAGAGDFVAASGALTFAPGETTKQLQVFANGDTLDEPDETFVVTLSGATNAILTRAQGTGTIVNDDGAPTLLIGDASAIEGDSGSSMATFTVTLAGSTEKTVTVDYSVADGTGTANADYAPVTGRLTFLPGVTSQTIAVPILGDTAIEASETFFVNLAAASNASIADGQALGTITNDDTAPVVPSISIGDVTLAEGNAGTTDFTFALTLSQPTTVPVSVDVATADVTATAGLDYAAAAGTVTFAPGSTTQSVTVVVAGDASVETNETFSINLTNAVSATLLDAQGTGTIANDDVAAVVPSISIGDVSLAEGNAGTTSFTFAVTLSQPTTTTVSVSYATADGSAVAGSDYAATTGTVVFAPGVTSQPLSIGVAGDTNVESDETFVINLSGAMNATLLDGQGSGTIVNDDTAAVVPSVAIGNTSVTEGNSGTATATFTVTLTAATTVPIAVDYSTADGTANAGSDYAATSGTLVFAPGVTAQDVTVAVAGDSSVEPDETFVVNLTNVVNATIADAQATGTILNDDSAAVVPSITIGDANVTEGNSGTANVAFNVTLSQATTVPVSVDYATANGSATAGSDYAAATGTLTFAPGVTTQSITVAVAGDSAVEPNETFVINLSNASNATVADAQATGTILNDDSAAVVPSITIGDANVTEGNSGTANVAFNVTLSQPTTVPITVDYATANGSATAGSDYAAATGTLTFAAGLTTQSITVAVAGDTAVEADETFVINLANTVNATIADAQATGTILNDDSAAVVPSISIGDANVTEGNSGTANVTFNVTLSQPTTVPVTVGYATANGSATAGSDYAAATGTLTFAPGVTTQSISVAVAGDTVVEPNETFVVNLTNASNATIADAQATGTIINDDTAPSVSIADANVTEGNSGTAMATFVVTLSQAATSTVTVDYATADGTATAGSDYAAATGTLVFAPGVTSQSITIAVAGDTAVESDETFVVNLSNATLADGQATGTILNDDTAAVVPSVSIADTTVTEGNSGTVTATFLVTLSQPTTTTITVDYATANGTATAGSDYAATAGTLVFAPGVTSQSVTVAVAGDTAIESDETFVVNLSNASLADGQGIATILDDDAAVVVPSITIADANVAEGDSGTTNLTFHVTLSQATTTTVTVDYATANGTATAGSDYAATTGTLVFAPGVTSRTITIAVAGDTAVEPDETFTLNLSNAANATIGDAQATATILDDDTPAIVPSISINDPSVTEGNSGTTNLTFSVTLSQPTTATVVVDYATANGTATAGSDYAAAIGTLLFAPGVMTRTITIAVAGDTTVEPNETFAINLTNAGNATIADGQGLATILNDDIAITLPSVSIADAGALEGNSGTTTATFTVTLSAASTAPVTVDYATSDITASANIDYAPASGTLVFAPGTTTRTLAIVILGDADIEQNETFAVTLSNATLTRATATGTIVNDDAATIVPSLTIAGTTITEGNSGTASATFHVTLSAPAATTITVDYETADGTATAGADYAHTAGSLLFAAGQTARDITIPIVGDTLIESDETFRVILSAPANATLATDRASGTILDDDGGQLAAVVLIAGETNGAGALFRTTLQLHNASDNAASGNLVIRPMAASVTRNAPYALQPHETRTIAAGLTGMVTIDVAPLTGELPEAAIRIYSDRGEEGTSGFTMGFVPVSDAITAGHRGVLIAPDRAELMRYNVGVRALADGATLRFILRRANGDIAATVARSFAANALMQTSAVSLLSQPLHDNDSITIEVTAGSALVWGSAVDNISQDPSIAIAKRTR